MDYSTKEGTEKLPEGEEAVNCLTKFMIMDGAAYLEKAHSHLPPKELEEYLGESPGERVYLEKQVSTRYIYRVKEWPAK